MVLRNSVPLTHCLTKALQETTHHLTFGDGPGPGTDHVTGINKSMSPVEGQGVLVTFEHAKSDPRCLLFASPLNDCID